MRSIYSTLATIGFALCLVNSSPSWGWGAQPIQNVTDAPISGEKPATLAQVKSAIIRAGASLGWQMVETSPGVVRATLNLRKHTAVVDIPYSEKKYSIVFQSSINLDEKDGKIHKNYNSWVQNLSKKIGVEVMHQ